MALHLAVRSALLRPLLAVSVALASTVLLLPGGAAGQEGEWRAHGNANGRASVSNGTLQVRSMEPGGAWLHRDRPYSIARPYSVEFEVRISGRDNHWVTLYSDAFVHLVVDWGTEVKHWQPGLAYGISRRIASLEPGRWHRIRMEARPAERKFDVYIDGQKVGTARNLTPPHASHLDGLPGRTAGPEIVWVGDADDTSYRGGAYNRGSADWRNFQFYQPPAGAGGSDGYRPPPNPAGRVKAPPRADARLSPAADAEVYAYRYRNWHRHNRGKWFNMGAGWNAEGGEKRSYLRFDLEGQPPVSRAVLRLWLYSTEGEPGGQLGVYRVLGGWDEGTDTYHSGRVEETAAPGELAWHQQPRIADRHEVVFRTNRAESERIELDVTRLVRAWQGGLPNHGLVLKTTTQNPSRSDRSSVARFRTREFVDPCDRPRLLLYHGGAPPEQATAHPNVAGVWREVDGGCAGTTWEVGQIGDEVRAIAAEVRCADGSGGVWEGRDFRWEGPRTLTYRITHHDGREERHRVVFDAAGRRATVHISPGGGTVHIRWVADRRERPR